MEVFELTNGLFLVFRARFFSLIRKVLLFAAFLSLVLKPPAHSILFRALAKLPPFLLVYLALYLANDIIDLGRDRKKNVIRPSKVLALGRLSERVAGVLIAFFISLSFISGAFVLGPYEWLLIGTILLFGILRSFIKNEFVRALSIVILEFLNFLLFALFAGLLPDTRIIIIASGLSLAYGFGFYFYRKYSRKKLLVYAILSALSGLLAMAVIFAFKPLRDALLLSFSLLVIVVFWYLSLRRNNHFFAIVGGFLGLFTLLKYLLFG